MLRYPKYLFLTLIFTSRTYFYLHAQISMLLQVQEAQRRDREDLQQDSER